MLQKFSAYPVGAGNAAVQLAPIVATTNRRLKKMRLETTARTTLQLESAAAIIHNARRIESG